jgi:hypothetical protein
MISSVVTEQPMARDTAIHLEFRHNKLLEPTRNSLVSLLVTWEDPRPP